MPEPSPGEFCYWETVTDFSGDFDAIIDSGLGDESTVTMTDEAVGFQTSACGTWTRQ